LAAVRQVDDGITELATFGDTERRELVDAIGISELSRRLRLPKTLVRSALMQQAEDEDPQTQQTAGVRVEQSKPRYHYVLHMSGDATFNWPFFSRLKSMPSVEDQSRFMADPVTREDVTIFVWSSEPLDEVFSSIASETSTSILEITASLA
jgi:hypothetical protein